LTGILPFISTLVVYPFLYPFLSSGGVDFDPWLDDDDEFGGGKTVPVNTRGKYSSNNLQTRMQTQVKEGYDDDDDEEDIVRHELEASSSKNLNMISAGNLPLPYTTILP
jgi:hypothetical protein